MEVVILEGDKADNVIESLQALLDLDKLGKAEQGARILHTMARGMVAKANGDEAALLTECSKLLHIHNPAPGHLTPEVLADRLTRIAALPKHAEVMPDGSVYFAAVSDPLGTGEVWCEFSISEATRKGLTAALGAKGAVPAPTTPQ